MALMCFVAYHLFKSMTKNSSTETEFLTEAFRIITDGLLVFIRSARRS